LLDAEVPAIQLPPEDLTAAFTGGARAVVLALPRPSRTLCELADLAAYEHAVPWLPVILEHPFLRIGPLVVPPAGPCFRCYRARRLQHDTEREFSVAFEAAYDSGDSSGPIGYLPHHARLAAAATLRLLDQGCATSARALPGTGQVLAYDVVSGLLSVNRVVSCHDCTHAGSDESRPAPVDLPSIAAQAARARGRSERMVSV
jgi:bacteriocin biosynthesis cyclodehydratase domain-containing protein